MKKKNSRFQLFVAKLLVFLSTMILLMRYPDFYAQHYWLHRLSSAGIFFLGTHIIISFLSIIIISLYSKRNKYNNEEVMQNNFMLGINRIASVLNFSFFIVSLFFFFNINPLSVITSISIVAAALALLTKDYITNIINGLIIMFGERLSIGDYIVVQNHSGKIIDITLLNIVLQDDDYGIVLIPNMLVYATIIVNKSKRLHKKVMIDFELPPSFNWQINQLEDHLKLIIQKYDQVIEKQSFILKIMMITPEAVKFNLRFMLIRENKPLENEIKQSLNNEILEVIKLSIFNQGFANR